KRRTRLPRRCRPRPQVDAAREPRDTTMRVLMLGWEFPPFITGGLGTACHGLTRALDRRGVEVTFVLPRPVDRQHSLHVNLVSPRGFAPAEGRSMPREVRTLERRLQEVGVFSAPVASGEPSEIDA